jgi:transcriptional regulator with XRE-family HTH domain
MATFGERVKELRKEKGQTMREVVDVIPQKNAPANLKGQREQIEGYSSELKKGRELKASLYI